MFLSVTLNEGHKQLLRYDISDAIFQFLFSDIFANVFDEVLSNRRKRFDLKRTLTSEKSKKMIF